MGEIRFTRMTLALAGVALLAGSAVAAATESRAVRAAPRAPLLIAAASAGAHFVQVGAHRTRAASEDLWSRLQSLHPRRLGAESHFIVRRDFGPPRGTYFQIQLGPFAHRRAADAKCAVLRSDRIDCFVVRTLLEQVVAPAAGGPPAGAASTSAPAAETPPPDRAEPIQLIRSGLGQVGNE